MGIEGSPPMHLAVSVGALPGRGGDATAAAALRLLALGGGGALASPYSRDDNGRTPLHWAANNNSLDVAGLLLDRGANTDGIDLSWMDDHEDA